MKSLKCYDNRELSWLKFNERVLEEAKDKRNPLCEQLSFLSIFQSNLDEFFMVRCGSLLDTMREDPKMRENKTNMTSREQLRKIYDRVRELNIEKDKIYKNLCNQLSRKDVEIVDFHSITDAEANWLEAYFHVEIEPLLSPSIVSRRQPFPFLQNKAIYAVVVLEKPSNGKGKSSTRLGIVPCSNGVFPRIVNLPTSKNRFILVEELILHFAPRIFSKFKIKSKALIRIIRNADIELNEERETDRRRAMEDMIRKRKRLAPVKLEYFRPIDNTVVQSLCRHLKLTTKQAFYSESPLDLGFFSKVRDMLRHHRSLFYPRRVPQIPAWRDENKTVIEQILEKDRFLSFPYESITPFLELLQQAAKNPDVVSVKMTLYRVASNSKIVEALISAAEHGKEVIVLVELRARFDEENNIEWSRRLEDAGCHVIYGLDGLKVHSKLCLITMRKNDTISYITQIGTGNYNEKTSAIYTDYSVMTANEAIGKEASTIFQALLMGQTVEESEYLLVAPKCLQNKLADKIRHQTELAMAGKPAYIGLKLNSLTDKYLIDLLIEASCAGVKIEMVIRGISCLIAGVPKQTENITIRSIVGRYLEHTRIYIFGIHNPEIYIGSADWMTRNTRRRVEVATPILDKDIQQRILDMFRIMMQDNIKARIQQADGTYLVQMNDPKKCSKIKAINAQEYFYQQAYDALVPASETAVETEKEEKPKKTKKSNKKK